MRTLAKNAAAVHAQVRPGTAFLPPGPRETWTVGPMPFGADRNAITKALTSLPWEVKVLQPTKTIPGKGSMWVVQSITPPPQQMVQMSHGEVMFTKSRSSNDETSKSSAPIPVASAETLALCGHAKAQAKPAAATASSDPWLAKDPWGGWKGVQGPDVQTALQQMESKVHDAVMAKLPTGPMEQDDVPDRVATLEHQVQSLLHGQKQLEKKVDDSASQQSAHLATLQHQFHGHVETQQQHVTAMFEQQMQQIRSLLSKRPREELE